MWITFRATQGNFVAEEDALVCGLGGPDATGTEHTLILQRTADGVPTREDWGVYLEFDDQINSGYGCVRRCHLTRQRLSLRVEGRLGNLGFIDGFDVPLAVSGPIYEQIRAGLPRIFRGLPDAVEMI